LPALQEAFHGLASARFNIAALNKLHRDLKGLAEARSSASRESDGTAAPPLLLEEELALRKVSYTYPDADRPAIKNLSLAIPARSMVGFVGKTGSGKTTAVDLALGLLRPQEGEITIDGTPLRAKNLRRWQQTLGYVPQHIYLSDDTVARNIAFGVPRDQIDMETVREAARRAHILDYVEQDLPNRWETVVGERGVKLSGGQRQRIGIARALYHDPSVLVFDEATSALDQSTEAGVMEAIYDLEGEQTILIISHRLSTVQRADNIFMLEEGRKVGEGSYDELLGPALQVPLDGPLVAADAVPTVSPGPSPRHERRYTSHVYPRRGHEVRNDELAPVPRCAPAGLHVGPEGAGLFPAAQ
jgi:ABC-type bacteriocin/lantibiotic exporters, contain an N-terminal double-glycine peptidase domain